MSLRRVLNARLEGGTVRIRPQVEEFVVIVVLLTKGDSGRATPDRIDVELDRSAAECDVLEYCIAAVQSHQTARKSLHLEELRILLGLPALGCHGNFNWIRALGNRKRRQEAYADRHYKNLHDPSV